MKNVPLKRGKKRGPAKKKNSKKTSDIQIIDKNNVLVSGMEINIETITDDQLYGLRKVLPRKDYR